LARTPPLAPRRQERLHSEPTRQSEYRKPAERDCDRILYCSAYRRLAGVTQVLDISERQLFHNRLTHTIKVAHVGRQLAQVLAGKSGAVSLRRAGGVDPDVVEAACRPHDLGHPPFGHIGEEELQACIDAWNRERASRAESQGHPKPLELDSFEGNAQTFRIVTKLAIRSYDSQRPPESRITSLNLTRATLAAILKYPWLSNAARHNKWGAYLSEREEFDFAVNNDAHPSVSTEGTVMDWADDVTYAVHDLEDFIRAEMIPLYLLVTDQRESDAFVDYAFARLEKTGRTYSNSEMRHSWEILKKLFLLPTTYRGNAESRAGLHELATSLLTRYVDEVSLVEGRLQVPPAIRLEVDTLMQLTWYYVIESPALASRQRGQREVISGLFKRLMRWTSTALHEKQESRRLPTQLQTLIKMSEDHTGSATWAANDRELKAARAVVDYISGLTEFQTLDLYGRLTGTSVGSALEKWLGV